MKLICPQISKLRTILLIEYYQCIAREYYGIQWNTRDYIVNHRTRLTIEYGLWTREQVL